MKSAIRMHPLPRLALAALLLATGPAGCVSLNTLTFGLVGDKGASLTSVRVEAAAEANTDMATALDLVFAYEKPVAGRLPDNAPAWFKRRAALRKAHPDALDVVSLQIPPGHTVNDVALPDHAGDAVAIVAYANYVAAAGQAPLDLTGITDAVIHLLARDVALGTGDAAQGGEG